MQIAPDLARPPMESSSTVSSLSLGQVGGQASCWPLLEQQSILQLSSGLAPSLGFVYLLSEPPGLSWVLDWEQQRLPASSVTRASLDP